MNSKDCRKTNQFNRWLRYLFLEIRKGLRLIPFFFITIAVTSAIIIAAALLFSAAMGKAQILPKVTAAIVCVEKDEETGKYKDASIGLMSRLGIGRVKDMKSISTIADVTVMNIADSNNGLLDGTVDAAIYITPDVYDDINSGRNTPITIRLGKDAASLEGSLFGSLLSSGVRLIRTVEAAVYTPYSLGGTYELTDTAEAIGDRIFDAWLKIVLARGKMWGNESVSSFGDVSILNFYVLSGIIFIVMMFGVGFASFYTVSERQVLMMLRRSGMPGPAASAAKLFAITLVLALFTALLVIAGRTGISYTSLPEADAPAPILPIIAKAASDIIPGIPAILACALLISICIHLCGSLIVRGSFPMTWLLIVIALFVVSGGLLPTAYLPPVLRQAAPWSPIAICQKLLAPVVIP